MICRISFLDHLSFELTNRTAAYPTHMLLSYEMALERMRWYGSIRFLKAAPLESNLTSQD